MFIYDYIFMGCIVLAVIALLFSGEIEWFDYDDGEDDEDTREILDYGVVDVDSNKLVKKPKVKEILNRSKSREED